MHVSDPEAFFRPVDCRNERWDELGHHPDWSFHGRDFPSHEDLMAARDRVFARHSKVWFVGLHVGHDAENLAFVGATLDRFPNFSVELGARIGELGQTLNTGAHFLARAFVRMMLQIPERDRQMLIVLELGRMNLTRLEGSD
jgi:hypothetical protein